MCCEIYPPFIYFNRYMKLISILSREKNIYSLKKIYIYIGKSSGPISNYEMSDYNYTDRSKLQLSILTQNFFLSATRRKPSFGWPKSFPMLISVIIKSYAKMTGLGSCRSSSTRQPTESSFLKQRGGRQGSSSGGDLCDLRQPWGRGLVGR